MALRLAAEYGEIVAAVAEKAGVPVELMISLLDLEAEHQNLHGWGARPALRRAITAIVERALPAASTDDEANS